MEIILNGTPTVVSSPSVQDLLTELGFAGKPVVVEYNEGALLKSEHATTPLLANDRLEIVTLAAGG